MPPPTSLRCTRSTRPPRRSATAGWLTYDKLWRGSALRANTTLAHSAYTLVACEALTSDLCSVPPPVVHTQRRDSSARRRRLEPSGLKSFKVTQSVRRLYLSQWVSQWTAPRNKQTNKYNKQQHEEGHSRVAQHHAAAHIQSTNLPTHNKMIMIDYDD